MESSIALQGCGGSIQSTADRAILRAIKSLYVAPVSTNIVTLGGSHPSPTSDFATAIANKNILTLVLPGEALTAETENTPFGFDEQKALENSRSIEADGVLYSVLSYRRTYAEKICAVDVHFTVDVLQKGSGKKLLEIQKNRHQEGQFSIANNAINDLTLNVINDATEELHAELSK